MGNYSIQSSVYRVFWDHPYCVTWKSAGPVISIQKTQRFGINLRKTLIWRVLWL